MKKNLVRCSMLTVAALSLLVGGTAPNVTVKEQVTEAPVLVGKAIENSILDTKSMNIGSLIERGVAIAQNTQNESCEDVVQEQTDVAEQIEEKAAKIESDQVVANIDSYLNIRSDASEDAEVIGKFYTGNVGTIVEKGEEWSLVASGNAYGYVKNDYLLFGTDAESYIENNCDQVAKVTAETLNVRAEESTDSEVVTLFDEGNTITVLADEGEWVKVAASEDVVGYVARDYVYIDYIYETAVTIEEEEAAIAAQEEAERLAAEQAAAEQAAIEAAATVQQETTQQNETPRQEPATTEAAKKETATSTNISVSDGGSATEVVQQESVSGSGQEIANYAVQFVGNPYVYGGTSLTNGADCSGFVMSVYAHFGYSLPRVAADQAGAGTKVSTSDLQPGDLLFYHGFGHVAIYIGGGQVVHASNKATGIKISSYDYSPIDKAVRIVK